MSRGNNIHLEFHNYMLQNKIVEIFKFGLSDVIDIAFYLIFGIVLLKELFQRHSTMRV